MLRRGASLLVAISVILSMAPTAAAEFGYRDTGLDPDDVEPLTASDVDVRGTTRKVWQDDKGQRWFTLTVRAYEPFGGFYDIFVAVDSRGGPLRDADLHFVNFEGPPYCSLVFGDDGWSTAVNQEGKRVTCRFRLTYLHPNKRIRWRVRTDPGTEDPDTIDRAPQTGFFV